MKRIIVLILLLSAVVSVFGCGKDGRDQSVTTPVTTTEGEHIHVFDVKDTSAKYLRSEATCKSKNRYYYSCVCGETGTATFGDGDKKYHDFSAQKIDKKYLVSKANCSHGEVYALSCSVCGDKAPYGVFYIGDKTDHSFTASTPDGKYICTEATESSPATYYKSCKVCGQKGEQTFVYGEPLREYTEEERSKHIPISLTVSLYDSQNVIYGFTCNTEEMPLRPVLQITADGVTAEYPAAVTEETSYNRDDDIITYYVIKAEAKLEPNKTYTYRIYDKYIGVGSEEASIKAVDPSSEAFTFVNVTDTQTYNETNGEPFGKILSHISGKTDFLVHTGDFVEWSKYESDWTAILEANRQYLSGLPIMAVSGNHETTYQNGVNETYKHFNYLIPDQKSTNRGFFYSFEYGNVKFIMLNTNDLHSSKLTDEQYYWLLNELKNNACTWTIVTMHHPIYSTGFHGSELGLRSQLGGLFAEYGVDVVIQAHDHILQKTKPINADGVPSEANTVKEGNVTYTIDPSGVIYMMSGAGGNEYRDVYKPDKELYDFALGVRGPSWSEFTVEGNKLTVIMKYMNGDRAVELKRWGIIKNPAK